MKKVIIYILFMCFIDLEILLNFTNLPRICFFTHILECPCLYSMQYKHKLPDYIKVMKQFQEVEKEIVRLFLYSNVHES